MVCPTCGKEMEAGFLQSSREIVWDTEILRDVIRPKTDRGFCVAKGLFKIPNVKAWYCKNCKLLLSKLEN